MYSFYGMITRTIFCSLKRLTLSCSGGHICHEIRATKIALNETIWQLIEIYMLKYFKKYENYHISIVYVCNLLVLYDQLDIILVALSINLHGELSILYE